MAVNDELRSENVADILYIIVVSGTLSKAKDSNRFLGDAFVGVYLVLIGE